MYALAPSRCAPDAQPRLHRLVARPLGLLDGVPHRVHDHAEVVDAFAAGLEPVRVSARALQRLDQLEPRRLVVEREPRRELVRPSAVVRSHVVARTEGPPPPAPGALAGGVRSCIRSSANPEVAGSRSSSCILGGGRSRSGGSRARRPERSPRCHDDRRRARRAAVAAAATRAGRSRGWAALGTVLRDELGVTADHAVADLETHLTVAADQFPVLGRPACRTGEVLVRPGRCDAAGTREAKQFSVAAPAPVLGSATQPGDHRVERDVAQCREDMRFALNQN